MGIQPRGGIHPAVSAPVGEHRRIAHHVVLPGGQRACRRALGRPKQPYAARCDDALEGLYNNDLFWDKDNTHTEDLDTYLPINRLREFAAEGRIGAVSERFYGIPTDYSQRRTQRNDSPRIEEWMRQDGVDVALLVPL